MTVNMHRWNDVNHSLHKRLFETTTSKMHLRYQFHFLRKNQIPALQERSIQLIRCAVRTSKSDLFHCNRVLFQCIFSLPPRSFSMLFFAATTFFFNALIRCHHVLFRCTYSLPPHSFPMHLFAATTFLFDAYFFAATTFFIDAFFRGHHVLFRCTYLLPPRPFSMHLFAGLLDSNFAISVFLFIKWTNSSSLNQSLIS